MVKYVRVTDRDGACHRAAGSGALLVGALALVLAAGFAARAEVPARAGGAAAAPPRADAEAPPVSMRDTLLAGGVRLLFEATVQHVDLETLKANGIAKIRERDEKDYRAQFDKVFDDLESVGVEEVLGVTRASSREDVIAALERTDKAELLSALNRIPDASIAKLVDRKLRERGASTLAEAQQVIQTELTEFVAGLSG